MPVNQVSYSFARASLHRLLTTLSIIVRTPLNAIISCLEVALNGTLDTDTRDNIAKSYAASRTLVHVINDLLDLTRTEQGNELFLRDPFDLPAAITDAVAVHAKEARRRGLMVEIVESPVRSSLVASRPVMSAKQSSFVRKQQGTPVIVLGDPNKVGRIVAECCSNAVRHTETGGILIEWGELVDTNLEDAEGKMDSIRIGISMYVISLTFSCCSVLSRAVLTGRRLADSHSTDTG